MGEVQLRMHHWRPNRPSECRGKCFQFTASPNGTVEKAELAMLEGYQEEADI